LTGVRHLKQVLFTEHHKEPLPRIESVLQQETHLTHFSHDVYTVKFFENLFLTFFVKFHFILFKRFTMVAFLNTAEDPFQCVLEDIRTSDP